MENHYRSGVGNRVITLPKLSLLGVKHNSYTSQVFDAVVLCSEPFLPLHKLVLNLHKLVLNQSVLSYLWHAVCGQVKLGKKKLTVDPKSSDSVPTFWGSQLHLEKTSRTDS